MTTDRSELGTEALDEAEQAEQERIDDAILLKFPKPTESDVKWQLNRLRNVWQYFHNGYPGVGQENATADSWSNPGVRGTRAVRYGEDAIPEKIRSKFKQKTLHVRTQHTDHETTNVVNAIMQNPPEFYIPSLDENDQERANATKELQFVDSVFDHIEEYRGEAVRLRALDNAMEGGVGAVVFYEPEEYEGLPKPPPIAYRSIDSLALFLDWADPEHPIAIIEERKPKRHPDTEKVPISRNATGYPKDDPNVQGDVVNTIHYFDRIWEVFIVEGATEPLIRRHGFPHIPVVPLICMETGATVPHQRHRGAAKGFAPVERALNLIVTQGVDNGLTFSTPKAVMTADDVDKAAPPEAGEKVEMDWSTDDIPYAKPGWTPVNLTEHLRPAFDAQLASVLAGIVGAQQMSPVLTGEAPGADTPGYAINALQAGGTLPYLAGFRGYGRFMAKCANFVRRHLEKHDLNMTLNVNSEPGEERSGRERITFGATDVGPADFEVDIDTVAPHNRPAIAAHLGNGHAQGLVPDDVVQRRGYGSRNPEAWAERIALNMLVRAGLAPAAQLLIETLHPGSIATGPEGAAEGDPSREEMRQTGAVPADLDPPTIGAGGRGQEGTGPDQSGARNPAALRAGFQQPGQARGQP